MPLACVDLLPWRHSGDGVEVLLIERRQRSELTGWALVGGRIMFGESVAEAAARHLRETLGADLEMRAPDWAVSDRVAEYRRGGGEDASGTFDPDRHSVALNYAVEVSGESIAAGEALGCGWFAVETLPSPAEVVFGQRALIGALADAAEARSRS